MNMVKNIYITAKGGRNMKMLGIATIIMGVLAITSPVITGVSITFLVGLFVLAGGLARMVWALRTSSIDKGKGLLGFAIGLLTLLCGIALVTDPLLASGILTIILAAYLLIDGVLEVTAAIQVHPASGWRWLLGGGIFSILLGLMIWKQFPLSGAWAIGFLLGLKLLLIGMIMIGVNPITPLNK